MITVDTKVMWFGNIRRNDKMFFVFQFIKALLRKRLLKICLSVHFEQVNPIFAVFVVFHDKFVKKIGVAWYSRSPIAYPLEGFVSATME